MGKSFVLDRVDADLAQGHTQPAIQRLSSLVAAHPTDLELRRRLAAVHRQVGNQVEAGRWSYLSPDAVSAEIEAFERAYPSPAHRLWKLRWPIPLTQAPTEFARVRLAALVEQAPSLPAARRRIPIVVVLAFGATLAVALATLGAVTVVQWLIHAG